VENPNRAQLYREAGVDIDKGDALVEWLQDGESSAMRSRGGSVVSGIGGFGALFRPDFSRYRDPLLVSATDGLGQDLVAMCANDLLTMGAQPLFFLDYYASGALDDKTFKAIISGIRRAVAMCGAVLVGGETAEMPGLYSKGHFDLAGFMVGMVDGQKVCGPSWVKDGDVLIGLPSSGFHSNGYSLIRKWLGDASHVDAKLLDRLMAPTHVYGEVLDLVEKFGPEKIHAMAHITGGGISGNLVRVLPEGVQAQIQRSSIATPLWMRDFISANGATIDDVEPVFNLGVGMILVVEKSSASEVQEFLAGKKIEPMSLGNITKTNSATKFSYV
jgi:phosphoribosylformylglycinamidine cyclo-ligase